jgi:hypothetical protein
MTRRHLENNEKFNMWAITVPKLEKGKWEKSNTWLLTKNLWAIWKSARHKFKKVYLSLTGLLPRKRDY